MAKNIKEKERNSVRVSSFGAMDADDLKSLIRDGLMAMTIAEREEFIRMLAGELQRDNIKMSAYLVPLGIPGRSAEDLTPTEVGHLVRYLKINIPNSVRAVERTLNHYNGFADKTGSDRIAA